MQIQEKLGAFNVKGTFAPAVVALTILGEYAKNRLIVRLASEALSGTSPPLQLLVDIPQVPRVWYATGAGRDNGLGHV